MITSGNSSSGIHEAASFKVPVINIGQGKVEDTKPKMFKCKLYKKEIKSYQKSKSQRFL